MSLLRGLLPTSGVCLPGTPWTMYSHTFYASKALKPNFPVWLDSFPEGGHLPPFFLPQELAHLSSAFLSYLLSPARPSHIPQSTHPT